VHLAFGRPNGIGSGHVFADHWFRLDTDNGTIDAVGLVQQRQIQRDRARPFDPGFPLRRLRRANDRFREDCRRMEPWVFHCGRIEPWVFGCRQMEPSVFGCGRMEPWS
jgi:hypothetical protein